MDDDVHLTHQMGVEGGNVDLDAPAPLILVEVEQVSGGGGCRGRKGSAAASVRREGWDGEEGSIWGRTGGGGAYNVFL